MALTGTGSDIDIQISGDSDGLRSAIGSAIREMSSFEKAVAGVGLALAGLATEGLRRSVGAASDFQTAMADVEKVTDPETAEAMSVAVRDLAADLPLAHEEIAELVVQAGRMGAEGADEIEEFTRVAAEMGLATTLGTEEAGTALGKLMSALDEPLDSVRQLGDATNELSNNFQTDSAEIVDSAQRSGQSLSALGLQSDEILAVAAAFNEVSPSSEIAAQNMKQVSDAMMDPENVGVFADALGMTSDEFVTMRDESPEETLLMLMDAVDDGTLSWQDLTEHLTSRQAEAFRDTAGQSDRLRDAMEMSNDAVEEGGSLAQEVATHNDTLSARVGILRNRLRNLAIAAGENLLPALEWLVDALIDGLDWFERIDKSSGGWVGTLGLIAGVIVGVVSAAAVLIKTLGGLALIKVGVVAAAKALFVGLSALMGPIGLIIAGVVALAAAFIKDFAGIRTATMRVVDALREALQPAFEWLQERGPEIFEAIKTAVLDFVERAEPVIETIVESIAEGLIATIEWLGEVVPPILQGLWEDWQTFSEVVGEAVSFVWETILQPYIEWIQSQWAEHGQDIAEQARETWDAVTEAVADMDEKVRPVLEELLEFFAGEFERLKEIVEIALDAIELVWDEWGDEIMTVVEFYFDLIKTNIEFWLDTISTALSVSLALIRGDWEEAWDLVVEFLERSLDRIIEFATEWGGRLVDWIGQVVEDIIGWFKDLASELVGNSIIPDMFDAIIEVAEAFGDRIVEVISNLVEAAVEQFEEWRERAVEAVEDLRESATEAVENLRDNAVEAVENLRDQAVEAFENFREEAINKAEEIREQVVQAIDDLKEQAVESVENLKEQGVQAFEDFKTEAVSTAEDLVNDVIAEFEQLKDDVEKEVDDAIERGLTVLENAVSTFRDAGENLIQGFIDGIGVPDVKGAVQDVVGKARDQLTFSDAKEGPLSDISKTGPAFVKTIADGITDNIRTLEGASRSAAGAMALDADPRLFATGGAGSTGRTDRSKTININIDGIEASGRAEGREAARALESEIRSLL